VRAGHDLRAHRPRFTSGETLLHERLAARRPRSRHAGDAMLLSGNDPADPEKTCPPNRFDLYLS
jgi:hypothetical protein